MSGAASPELKLPTKVSGEETRCGPYGRVQRQFCSLPDALQ